MSSNSVRITAELFESAREQGLVLSRSAAQQVEHWARLGAVLESAGLTVQEVIEMLRGGEEGAQASSEQSLWAFKRAQQARDIEAVAHGRASTAQMSWFAGGKAKRAKLTRSPY